MPAAGVGDAKRVGIGFLRSGGDSRSGYLLARGGEFDSLIKDTLDITVSVLKGRSALHAWPISIRILDRHTMMGEWPGIAGHSKTIWRTASTRHLKRGYRMTGIPARTLKRRTKNAAW